MKCVLVLLCAVCVVLCIAQHREDDVEEHHIKEAADFINLFDTENNKWLYQNVILENDIDFITTPLTRPLGTNDQACTPFSGTFDGGNFSINGLQMGIADEKDETNEKGKASLFCGLKNAIIKNLVIGLSCSFFSYPSASALCLEA